VGRDAESHAGAIAALARAGHEVASHSQSHPMAFSRLTPAAMREELCSSRRRLEAAGGSAVIGFRSPNFDLDPRAAEALLDSGYRYDASGYPTPLLASARLLLALKSRDAGAVLRLRLWPFTMSRRPYGWKRGARVLREFPVSVTPGIRLPVYHTARYFIGEARFTGLLDGFARRGEPLSYPLHAVDALGLTEDRVDVRLGPHPGMDRSLAFKLELLERSLAAIAERFECRTFAQRIGSGTEQGGSSRPPGSVTD
jgi:peptidoglycan-N-acetylglucosamine deacetylase